MLRKAFRPSYIRPQPLKYKRQYSLFRISPEVYDAIRARRPVVALESTIYTHGFPYPDNAALALSLEAVVRLNGGVPATIGVLNGEARVGLSPDELLELASAAGKPETMKVSRRDLGFITGMSAAGRPLNGGTTISGTMILAAKAGIKVFGTGGLGGVHRGGEDTMDVSADLTELGRTPVCVVSSGCKSFLDIPRTLEYLETHGALVATFADGRSGDIDFPAFWTRDSGVKSPTVIQTPFEAASIIHAQKQLGIRSGMLFANPIPIEHSIPKSEMDIAINAAIQEANEKGFFGHRNTPFILAKIKELTEGKSVPANKALVESNVAIATRIAVELSKMQQAEADSTESGKGSVSVRFYHSPYLDDARCSKTRSTEPGHRFSRRRSRDPTSTQVPLSSTGSKVSSKRAPLYANKPYVVVIGSIAMDLACNYAPFDSSKLSPQLFTSNPAILKSTVGGVGNNVANAISKVTESEGLTVQLRSFVGDDISGNAILDDLEYRNQMTSGIKVLDGSRTAQYVSINDAKKDLVMAMADMSILDVDESIWDQYSKEMSDSPVPKYLVVDANWPANIIANCVENGKKQGSTVVFEPVSTAKSARLFTRNQEGSKLTPPLGIYPDHHVDISSPNEHELAAMYTAAKSANLMESPKWFQVIDELGIPNSGARDRFQALTSKEIVDAGVPQQTIQLLPFIPTILTKLGPSGVLLTELLGPDDERLKSEAEAPYILSRCSSGGRLVGGVYMRHFDAMPVESGEVKSVNGAGDTFLGVIVGGLACGAKLDDRLITLAQVAAVMTLKSELAVSDSLKSLQTSLEKLL